LITESRGTFPRLTWFHLEGRRKGRGMGAAFSSEQYRELAKADFWTKTEIHVLLLGSEYPSFVDDSVPADWDEDVLLHSNRRLAKEQILKDIDQKLDDAVQLNVLKTKKGDISRNLFPTCVLLSLKSVGIGYEVLGVLTVLRDKEFPIPKDLIQALNDKNWNVAAQSFLKLHENMVYRVDNGRNPPNPDSTPNKVFSRDTEQTKMDFLKKQLEKIGIPLFKKNPQMTLKEFIEHPDVQMEIKGSGMPKGKPSISTLQKWTRKIRKKAGTPGRPGRPRQK